jgi:hypothetical protein
MTGFLARFDCQTAEGVRPHSRDAMRPSFA